MSIGAVCLIDIPAALRAPLEQALGDVGCRIDERRAHRADPAALLLHALDGSPACLASLQDALAVSGSPVRARAVLLAGEAGAAQAAALELPATWALLPWPAPAGWLALTIRRARQLAALASIAGPADAVAVDARAPGSGANVLAQALSASGLFDFEYDLGNGQRRPASSDAAMLGHSPKDFAEAMSYIHPDDRAHVREAFQRCRATGCAYHVELRVLRREGSYRWMRSEGSVVDRSASHPGRLLGVNRDIHEEREARDAARSARRRLDQALTTAGMLSWEWEPTDGMRRVVGNGLGLPRSEHEPGLALEDLIHAEDRDVDRQRFDHAVRNVDRYQSEIRIEVPGLGARWLQLTGYPRRAASGQVVGMSGLGLDVTRRRIADEELADAHALLIDSLEAGRMYCWEHNLIDGSRRTIGPYQDILGVAADAALGAKALLHPADVAEDSARWIAAIEQRSTYESTYRVIRPDGQIRWMQSRGNPILGADGKVARISGVAIDISEQRRTEERLASSLTKLDRVQTATHVVLWEWNRARGTRCYQSGGLELAGADLPAIHPDDVHRVLRRMLRCVSSNQVFDEEFRVSDGPHNYRWVAVQGARSNAQADDAVTVSGVMIDISARKRVAEELSLAQERLRRALDAARMVCWDWHTQSAGGTGAAETGYTPTVARASSHGDSGMVHPDDRSRHQAAIADALAGRSASYRCEFRLLRPDGSVTWLLSIGSSLRDSHGRVVGLTGVAIDISAQKGIESELAESREWQRLAVEAGELNLWQVDVASGERRGGGLDQRLFGCVPTHIGELAELTHPEDRERVDAAWRASVEHGVPYDLDYRLLHRDGTIRWVRVRGKCLRDATLGRPVMVGASMDITEQVQLETELRNAVRLARAASEAKSAFLASISHELRTPLNAVIGFSGLLLDSATDRVQSAHLNSLNSAAQLLYTLINDVLDFSRIEAGEMAIESTPFCLQECLETALDMVAASASGKGLSLLMTTRGTVHRKVVGDPTRLRQVAVNLLSNATKFTQRGMVALELEGAEHADGIELTMCVHDTGIGMSADVLGLLFEPFRQGDVSTTRRFGGTGLGLSICKRLIGLMGGSIEVSSKPGAGSCFTVRLLLPLARERGERPAMLYGRRIGVAVDKVFIRNALIRQLQELGADAVALDSDAPMSLFDDTRAALDVLVVTERSVREHLAKATNWPRGGAGAPLPVIVLAPFDKPLQPWRGRHGESYFPIAQILKPRTLQHALRQALDDGSAPLAPACPGTAASLREAAGRFSSLRVLVAEDNEINQTLILLQLQSFGVTATLVGNGREALDALRAAPFDVVLMDVEMPGMDGMEAATHIRDDPELRGNSPYVIAVTAHVLGGSRQRFMAAGMDDLISKPVMMDDLRDALDRVLASRQRPSDRRRHAESRLPELGD